MAGRGTLDELYVLVPSTEEHDLGEEAEVERLHARLVKEYAAVLGAPDDDPVDEGRGPEWPPTDAQALGCLEHLLGARLLPPERPPGAVPPGSEPSATPG